MMKGVELRWVYGEWCKILYSSSTLEQTQNEWRYAIGWWRSGVCLLLF